jgi:hypothetical protein
MVVAGARDLRKGVRNVGRSGMGKKPVMLVRLPPLLRELVGNVVAVEPDLAIFDGDEALRRLRVGGACLVITHLDGQESTSLAELLGARLDVRVIGLSADGRRGTVYDVRLQERRLGSGEISLAELLAAIREPINTSLIGSSDD